jgi:hypothetical protein
MEDKQSIKKVLESQGDVHEKVANHRIRNCRVRVQLRVQDNLVFKLTSRLYTTSVLDDLHMHGKVRRYRFQWDQSHAQQKLESSIIIKTVPITRTIFGAAPPFWPDGPCIQLESIRDAS